MGSKLIQMGIPCLLAALASGCGGGGGGGGGGSKSSGHPVPQAGPVTIRSFSPSSDSRVPSGTPVVFRVTLEDTEEAVPEFAWKVDGVPSGGPGPVLLLDTGAGDPVVRWVEAEISQGGGESTTLLWRLQLLDGPADNAPPTISCALPTGPLNLVSGDQVDLSIEAGDEDAHDSLDYSWSIDGQPPTSGEQTFSLESAQMAMGSHSVRVYVKDDAATPDADAPSFAWEVAVADASGNRAPIIISASPPCPVRISSGSLLVLGASALDLEGDPLSYHWSLDGELRPESGDTFQLRTSSTDERDRTVRLTVADSQGAESPAFEWKVMIAQPPPPDPDAGSVSVSWNEVLDDVNGDPELIGGYRVYASPDPNSMVFQIDVGPRTEATLRRLHRGATYWISVSAYDQAGNEGDLSSPIDLVVP
jgi:fibronectin type III domain protein